MSAVLLIVAGCLLVFAVGAIALAFMVANNPRSKSKKGPTGKGGSGGSSGGVTVAASDGGGAGSSGGSSGQFGKWTVPSPSRNDIKWCPTTMSDSEDDGSCFALTYQHCTDGYKDQSKIPDSVRGAKSSAMQQVYDIQKSCTSDDSGRVPTYKCLSKPPGDWTTVCVARPDLAGKGRCAKVAKDEWRMWVKGEDPERKSECQFSTLYLKAHFRGNKIQGQYTGQDSAAMDTSSMAVGFAALCCAVLIILGGVLALVMVANASSSSSSSSGKGQHTRPATSPANAQTPLSKYNACVANKSKVCYHSGGAPSCLSAVKRQCDKDNKTSFSVVTTSPEKTRWDACVANKAKACYRQGDSQTCMNVGQRQCDKDLGTSFTVITTVPAAAPASGSGVTSADALLVGTPLWDACVARVPACSARGCNSNPAVQCAKYKGR